MQKILFSKCSLSVLVVLGVLFSSNVYAMNGAKVIGNSTRDIAMGGATTASPGDTSVMVKNPAGLIKVGNRFDLSLGSYIVSATSQPKGALGNDGVTQKTDAKYCPIGNIAVSIKKEDGNMPMAFGIGLFSIAGVSSDFPRPRMGGAVSAIVTDYDTKMDLKHMRLSPTVAFQVTDKLAVGLSYNLGISMFRTDLPVAGTYAKNRGALDWETALGSGFTIGVLFDVTDYLRLGFSYESETWMSDFKRYDQVFKRMDIPPVANAGISYNINDRLEITYDAHYIFWTRSKMTRDVPSHGGFGWRDQLVHAIGLEYEASDKLTLRLGYNYGKAPIREDVVFANALAPLIIEQHVSFGLSQKLDDEWTLDLTYVHAFEKSITDNGKGDSYSQAGANTSVEASGELVIVGVGRDF